MSSEDFLVAPKALPALNIPASSSTVSVSVIDSTTRLDFPISLLLQPHIKGHDRLICPSYSFLIQHPDGKTLLFDLGMRKDWENLAPRIVKRIRTEDWTVKAEKNVADILQENGFKLKDISAIIWSHHHWDHTGDPSTFPSSTDLIVGPGFKEAQTPAYPDNPESGIKEADWAGRTLHELSFSASSLRVGRFDALDYFGDGSFYLLHTPGHAVGHLSGLARVTTSPKDTFILMGGDICHHAAEFRPTPSLPLPATLSPSPVPSFGSICSGALFQSIHPRKSATEPFYEMAEGMAQDAEKAEWSVQGVEEFDAAEEVLVVMAHDESLRGCLRFWPERVDGWWEEGVGKRGRWAFLRDFGDAVEGLGVEMEEKL
ncbi:hypothetical protein H2201_004998 [Coniosporium apollinis]|uniref:Metallo-beta-lactamase domain-containing protein n=1 Tax=Coniosporium apollinis TaxID=61459 RepID=A0ABQ9NTG8_9PEZI|nr:hypothetical protein H2201_004998 [Coniosporium apollinis]